MAGVLEWLVNMSRGCSGSRIQFSPEDGWQSREWRLLVLDLCQGALPPLGLLCSHGIGPHIDEIRWMSKLIDNLLRVSRIARLGTGLAILVVDSIVSDVGHDFDIKAAQD